MPSPEYKNLKLEYESNCPEENEHLHELRRIDEINAKDEKIQDRDFSFYKFTNCVFELCWLRCSKFWSSTFELCVFKDNDFAYCDICDSLFSNTILYGSFSNASAKYSMFLNSECTFIADNSFDLEHCSFSSSVITCDTTKYIGRIVYCKFWASNFSFRKIKMAGGRFTSGQISQTYKMLVPGSHSEEDEDYREIFRFHEGEKVSTFFAVNFTSVDFIGKFKNCEFIKCSFETCDFSQAIFEDCKFDDCLELGNINSEAISWK